MNALQKTSLLFFDSLPIEQTKQIVQDALTASDDGELFLEYAYCENLFLDQSCIKSSTYDISAGFGLRAVCGDSFAYAFSNDLTIKALLEAKASLDPIKKGYSTASGGVNIASSTRQTKALYTDANPLTLIDFDQKVALMSQIDVYARAKEAKITHVSANLAGSWQAVQIIDAFGNQTADIRPMVRLSVSVVVQQGDRMESGSKGLGGRCLYTTLLDPKTWKACVDEAIRQALVALDSRPAPSGELPVVVGSGWCGVLLHEAVGHGLEGDFNRKKTSVFTDKIGQQVTAKGITIVDDGTLPNLRGSITIDDEGTPSQRTVLIEDGILKNYLFDKMNARLMNTKSTGNGRRESFSSAPQVRMTNTFMQKGNNTQEEMIKSIKKGVFAQNFSGGQVDITSGNFVFTSSEAYLIEDGKLTAPLKDATLIGSGIDVMNAIDMIGTDECLDDGIGTCGKGGQSVPVGVGQPSVRIKKITVGGG